MYNQDQRKFRQNKMKLSVFICLSIFSAAMQLYAQAPAALNVAVNDLIGKGIEQSSAAIISDRLRSELINTGAFRVMERNEMDNILKEQGFQKSGACDDATCLVEVGQLLGVERMVAGTVGKIETLYTISLRMINVATGQIMFTVNEDFEGDIKSLLVNTKRADQHPAFRREAVGDKDRHRKPATAFLLSHRKRQSCDSSCMQETKKRCAAW